MLAQNRVRTRARRAVGKRARPGFTLIELLIALVLLNVGLLALVSLGAALARDATFGRVTLIATTIAVARVERLGSLACTTPVAGHEEPGNGITEVFADSPGPWGTRRLVDSVTAVTSRGPLRITLTTGGRC